MCDGNALPGLAGAERSARERAGEAGKDLDQIRLPACAGLFIKALEMGFDRALADAERLGDLWRAADLDDGQQDADLHRRQPVCLGDRLRRGACGQSGFLHEQTAAAA